MYVVDREVGRILRVRRQRSLAAVATAFAAMAVRRTFYVVRDATAPFRRAIRRAVAPFPDENIVPVVPFGRFTQHGIAVNIQSTSSLMTVGLSYHISTYFRNNSPKCGHRYLNSVGATYVK